MISLIRALDVKMWNKLEARTDNAQPSLAARICSILDGMTRDFKEDENAPFAVRVVSPSQQPADA